MKVRLSKRLAAVAGFVPEGSSVADIGTDHGYLPVHLVLNGISPWAVASDAAKSPLAAAGGFVNLLGLGRTIDLRLGDGLLVLRPGEVETVCIAGMGSSTIIKILEQSPEVLEKVKRLVLQPMKGAPAVRRWLAAHGWQIIDEKLVYEDKIFYEIIAAEPGKQSLSEMEEEIGPVLMNIRHQLLRKYIEQRIDYLKKVHTSLSKCQGTGAREKKVLVEAKILRLQQMLAAVVKG